MANTALTYSYLAVTGDAFISRATPIDRIDGKGHNLKLRNHLSKSYKVQIMLLVTYAPRGGYTHIYVHVY